MAHFEGTGLGTSEIFDHLDTISYTDTRDSEGNSLQGVSDPRVSSK